MSDNHEMRLFATVDGLEVKVRPVSQFLMQKVAGAVESRLRREGLPLDVPMYTATTASGATETHPHDATTVQTDEERAAWAAYQAATLRLKREQEAATTRLFLLRGLDVAAPPVAWLDDMARLGIKLPDPEKEPDDLRLEYIQIEVLKTPEDIIRATMAIARLSALGAPQGDIDAAEASFRRALQTAAAPVDQPAAG